MQPLLVIFFIALLDHFGSQNCLIWVEGSDRHPCSEVGHEEYYEHAKTSTTPP